MEDTKNQSQDSIENENDDDKVTINLGIIGCGKHILQSHIFVKESKITHLQISGVYDPNTDNIDALANKLYEHNDQDYLPPLHYLKVYQSEDELLADPTVNAVIIGSPDKFHTESLCKAIKAGKHVFVEKPISINESEFLLASQAIEDAIKQNLVIMSCHAHRFEPGVQPELINQLIDQYKLGKCLEFRFDFSYHRSITNDSQKHQRSLMLDHVCHEIDLVNFIFGMSPAGGIIMEDTPDHYHVVGKRRQDNIIFNFSGTRLLEKNSFIETVAMRCQQGKMMIDLYNRRIQINCDHDNSIINLPIAHTDYNTRFRAIMTNFVKTIQGTEKPYVTPKEILFNNVFPFLLNRAIDEGSTNSTQDQTTKIKKKTISQAFKEKEPFIIPN